MALATKAEECQCCQEIDRCGEVMEPADSTEGVNKISLHTIFSANSGPVIFIETNRFLCSYELRQVRVSKESVDFAVMRPQKYIDKRDHLQRFISLTIIRMISSRLKRLLQKFKCP